MLLFDTSNSSRNWPRVINKQYSNWLLGYPILGVDLKIIIIIILPALYNGKKKKHSWLWRRMKLFSGKKELYQNIQCSHNTGLKQKMSCKENKDHLIFTSHQLAKYLSSFSWCTVSQSYWLPSAKRCWPLSLTSISSNLRSKRPFLQSYINLIQQHYILALKLEELPSATKP